MTSPDRPSDAFEPQFQLADSATADLQLRLDGVDLPWPVLGGSLRPDQPSAAPEHPEAVGVIVPAELAEAAHSAGRLLLTDREQTPIGALIDLRVAATDDEVLLTGRLEPARARESRLFLDRARPPVTLDPTSGTRHVVVVGRPLLTEDVDQIAALGGQLLLLVPVESPSPDGVPPVTLMRAVLHIADQFGQRAKVIATPMYWRDPESDEALAQAIGSAYSADRTRLLRGGATWAEVVAALRSGDDSPAVLDPAVLHELRRWRRPPAERGATILFTGFSGSGKSTLARDLAAHLVEHSERTVSLLDGDDVRRLLSAGLGFDRVARDLNVRRIGFVASEVARHGGLAICAPIAPYAESRAAARAMVEPHGDFLLVHVSTPLEECERRDLKGLYARARAGLVSEFTGISDPYDVPTDADLTIDTSQVPRGEALDRVLALLRSRGLIADDDSD